MTHGQSGLPVQRLLGQPLNQWQRPQVCEARVSHLSVKRRMKNLHEESGNTGSLLEDLIFGIWDASHIDRIQSLEIYSLRNPIVSQLVAVPSQKGRSILVVDLRESEGTKVLIHITPGSGAGGDLIHGP